MSTRSQVSGEVWFPSWLSPVRGQCQVLSEVPAAVMLSADQSNEADHRQTSIQEFSSSQSLSAHLSCGKVLPVALISQKGCSCHGCLQVGPDRSMTSQASLEGGQPSPEVRFKHLSGRFQRGQIRRPPAGRNLINRVDKVVAATFVAAGFWQRSALVLKPALSVHPGSLLHHCPRRCMNVYMTTVLTIAHFRVITILNFSGGL